MSFNFEAIFYYIGLVDSVVGNIVIWTSPKFIKWYKKNALISRYLPLTKGWMFIYLVLVLWLGNVLLRLGVLPW